jgi:hypothetical protein
VAALHDYTEVTVEELRTHIRPEKLVEVEGLITALRTSPDVIDAWVNNNLRLAYQVCPGPSSRCRRPTGAERRAFHSATNTSGPVPIENNTTNARTKTT